MTGHPLITIGITCFNAEATVARAIESALAQDWPAKEILIVDDGSADGSLEIIRRAIAGVPFARLIQQPENRGYPAALNEIIEAASGEFIAFFDDDDVSQPFRLRRQFERISGYERASGSDLVLCYSNRAVVARGASASSATTLAIGRQAPEPYGRMVADYLLLLLETPPFVWGQFGSCTLMLRKKTAEQVGRFDIAFRRGAEWDFAVRAAMKDAHFIAVNEPLISQYLTEGAGGEKSGPRALNYALALRRKHGDLLRPRGLFLASVAQAHARYHYARGERWRHRLFTLVAVLLAPVALLPHVVRKKRQKQAA